MTYDARLETKITSSVRLRLRMLALIEGRALSHVLDALLDQHLPPACELASQLSGDGEAVAS